MPITLCYARQRFDVDLSENDLATFPLSMLIEHASSLTGISPENIKLVYGGSVMRQPSAPLASYGIRPHDKITILGSIAASQPTQQQQQPVDGVDGGRVLGEASPESRIANQIRQLIDGTLEPLQSRITAFKSMIDGLPSNVPLTEQQNKEISTQHAFLTEKLMQGLLSVDGVNVPVGFEQAKEQRRTAVKILQSSLDELDALLRQVKP